MAFRSKAQKRRVAAKSLPGYIQDNGWRRNRKRLLSLFAIFCFFYGAAIGLYIGFRPQPLLIPLVPLALLIIWLLPDIEKVSIKAIIFFLFAEMMALLLWPDYLAIALPGMPWLTMMRITTIPLTLVLLTTFSISPEQRKLLRELYDAQPWVWRFFISFVILSTLSLGYSTDFDVTFNKLLIFILYCGSGFVAAALVFSTEGKINLFVKILVGILLVNFAIGIQEWRHSVVPWAGHIPSFLKIEDETVLRILAGQSRAGTNIYRLQSKFSTSIGFGEFMAMATPFILHLTVTAQRFWHRVGYGCLLGLLFWFVMKTDSRSAMSAYLITYMMYLFAWSFRRWQRERESIFGATLIFSYPAIFCAFMAATFFIGRLRVMVWGGGQHQASSDARATQVEMGLPMLATHPWGFGLGRGAEALGYTNLAGVLTIDTYYLNVALDVGILGFISFYGVLLATTVSGSLTALKSYDRETDFLVPIAISIVNFIVIKSVFSQTENHAFIFILAGMAVALIRRVKMQEAS